jgi:hypothetical protein
LARDSTKLRRRRATSWVRRGRGRGWARRSFRWRMDSVEDRKIVIWCESDTALRRRVISELRRQVVACCPKDSLLCLKFTVPASYNQLDFYTSSLVQHPLQHLLHLQRSGQADNLEIIRGRLGPTQLDELNLVQINHTPASVSHEWREALCLPRAIPPMLPCTRGRAPMRRHRECLPAASFLDRFQRWSRGAQQRREAT